DGRVQNRCGEPVEAQETEAVGDAQEAEALPDFRGYRRGDREAEVRDGGGRREGAKSPGSLGGNAIFEIECLIATGALPGCARLGRARAPGPTRAGDGLRPTVLEFPQLRTLRPGPYFDRTCTLDTRGGFRPPGGPSGAGDGRRRQCRPRRRHGRSFCAQSNDRAPGGEVSAPGNPTSAG